MAAKTRNNRVPTKRPRRPPSFALYWVETFDHDEDWFVVARSAGEAKSFFVNYEGYGYEDATARLVARFEDTRGLEVGWPEDEVLERCGGKILNAETPRVVEIGGERYCEGLLQHEILTLTDNIFEARGDGRLNKTTRSTGN